MRLFLFILLAGLFWACSSNDGLQGAVISDNLELSKEDVKLTNVEGSFTINITAIGDWNAEVTTDSEWLTLSRAKGSGSGDLRLFFTENTDPAKRIGKIKVTMPTSNLTMEQEITIEQLGSDPDILLDYSKEIISFAGTTLDCQIVSNVEWTIEIDDKHDWIEADLTTPGNRSLISTNVQLKIAPNVNTERIGEVIIKTVNGYVLKKTVKIIQEGIKNTLKVEQDEFIIPYKCKTLTVPIAQEHAIEYDLISTVSWITLDREASTEHALVLKIEDNVSFFPRTSSVTVKNSVVEQNIEIFQYGKPDTRIGDDPSAGQLLAFPGAEGGGRFTTGGRGGEIYRVTNLEDYNKGDTPIEGSLRYGIEKSAEPRTIIFDVSGVIELKRGLFLVDRPNISIIGQTAPGDGITLKNYNLSFNLSQQSKEMNAIIRFIRCRPGDKYEDYQEDAIGGRYFTNAIVDHVTASWGVDETLSFYGVQNFTAQWCTSTESLNFANHNKGAHGYGAMFSGDNASFHHILMAHHGSRCPRISDLPEPGTEGPGDHVGYFDVRNNVYYNWSEAGFGCYGGKYATFNIVNCYYKAGPATGTGSMAWRILSSDPTARAYIEGNYTTANQEVTSDNWTNGIWSQFWRDLNPTVAEMQAMRLATPQPFSKVTSHTAEQAYEKVLEYAGASLRRDAIDQRIVNEIRNKTTTYIGSKDDKPRPGIIDTVSDTEGYQVVKSLKAWTDTDGDGIPDIWEIAYGLDTEDPTDAAKISAEIDPNGRYSNLEVYFHNLVQHIVYYQNQGGQVLEKR